MPLSWKGPESTTKLVVWTMGQALCVFKMLLENSNVPPWFAASSLSWLFCTLTLLFFSPTAFLSTCAKLTAVFSMSSLKFVSCVFSESPLLLLLHDPYRKFMWQERKRLYRVKEQGLSQQRAMVQKALGGQWLAGFPWKPKWDAKQRREQRRRLPAATAAGLTMEQGWGCGLVWGRMRTSRCERPSHYEWPSPLPGPASLLSCGTTALSHLPLLLGG